MTDPPRKKQRAKRQEPDDVVDPNKRNATTELETADLVSLATGGLVEGKATKTRELQIADLEAPRHGMPSQDPKIIVDLGDTAPKEPNVFVDLGAAPEEIASAPQQAMPGPPRASTPVNIVAPRAPSPVPVQPLPQEHRISASIPVRPQAPKPRADVTPAPPRAITSELRAPKRGLGLVVLVYVIAAAALATSIYVRWFA